MTVIFGLKTIKLILKHFSAVISLLVLVLPLIAQPTIRLDETYKKRDLAPYLFILNDENGDIFFQDIAAAETKSSFRLIDQADIDYDAPVHWLRFQLFNELPQDDYYNLTIPFTDHIELYAIEDGQPVLVEKTGDLTPLNDRSNDLGKLVAMRFKVPAGASITYYVRLESATNISQQFKSFAVGAIRLFSDQGFTDRYVQPRIYQALFFGALIIMLLYNFFIYISLQDKNYLYYVFFILTLIVFLAADEGIIYELALRNNPRLDLYIRFLSSPILLFFYLFFSKAYLKTRYLQAKGEKYIQGFLYVNAFIIILMVLGQWHLGRSLAIISTAGSFLLILWLAISSYRNGFHPAKYFLAANILLLVGGIVFAMQRFSVVDQNPVTQYSVQISAVLQVALFSLGLADKINIVRKELAEKTLENERLERQKEIELKRIILEKNLELEQKVIERTTEIVEQKEEIEAQKESLIINNTELENAQKVIQNQNNQLTSYNARLELEVHDRTRELNELNEDLRKALDDLDNFIYKTAHDIRGPLARLMGLCGVALMDISDDKALIYLEKLKSNADHLSTILSRLSMIHEINHRSMANDLILFKDLIHTIIADNKHQPGYPEIVFNVDVDEQLQYKSDLFLLRLILMNLIDNSIKYYDPLKGNKSFVSVAVKEVNESLEISVIDNGIGLKEEEVPHLFDMFSPAAGVHQSPGLGLYIVKTCLEKLNGKIDVIKNKSNTNTHFLISIPMVKTQLPFEKM